MQLKLACGALAAAALYPGCAEKNEIPEITPQMALDHGLRPTDLARGRGIYMAHCASCHPRVKPGEIDPEF
ncbi:MAG: hypothetical protein ACON5H_02015 [Akkermansiaceae bacterium]